MAQLHNTIPNVMSVGTCKINLTMLAARTLLYLIDGLVKFASKTIKHQMT